MNISIDVKDYERYVSLETGILHALRLKPDEWIVVCVHTDMGDVPFFRDDGDPTIVTDTSEISTLSLGSIVIDVSYRHDKRHVCQSCGDPMGVNKWVTNTYTNSPIFGMDCKISVSVPQLHCKRCPGYPQVRCPLVVRNHTFTKLCKSEMLGTLAVQNVADTARSCRVGRHIVADVLKEAVDEGMKTQDLSGVDTIFMDEIQSTHGQNYITMFADQDHRCICGVIGHDIQSVHAGTEAMISHRLDPEKIRLVSADMSRAYKTGASECFPNSTLVIDRFHILKGCNETIDRARKRIVRELKAEGAQPPGKVKYTVLYRRKNHDEKHRDRMEAIRVYAPELALAFDLKEEFFELFEISADRHQARSRFFSWYNRARSSGIPELIDFAGHMIKRLNEILRCFDHRITNAVSEGMNNKYKKIKSAAYGFRKPENLINMCMFRMGRLDIRI